MGKTGQAGQAALFPPADWQGLQLGLDRCYEGPPVGRSGVYTGTVVTLCELRCGSLEMHREGVTIQADGAECPWIMSIPGERRQHFSDDSVIVSVHLSLKNPSNGAEWRGRPVVMAMPDGAARQSLSALQCAAIAAGLSPQQLEAYGLELALPEALGVQAACAVLFGHMLRLARPLGMRFEVPPIGDDRVRESHLRLAAMDIQAPFSREALAAGQGLTAGQLDRLWRQELGLTPHQYRDRQRLTYACEQLRRPSVSIKAIAADLGFRHLSQFSNWFRARQGESPRHFRNRPGFS
jgi:AraC-like DNA-binding protein